MAKTVKIYVRDVLWKEIELESIPKDNKIVIPIHGPSSGTCYSYTDEFYKKYYMQEKYPEPISIDIIGDKDKNIKCAFIYDPNICIYDEHLLFRAKEYDDVIRTERRIK